MGRFDKYIVSQLLLVFGFFALVLVGVYWVNRAVVLVDTFLASGQTGRLVFEMLLLTLPTLIKLVLPIAAFLAVLQVCHRLYSESELVVVQATGFSGFRLARPVLVFGLIVTVLISVLAHFLVPISMARLNAREAAIAEAASSRLLVPGTFQSPTRGVTVYVREIGTGGEITGLLLSDRRDGKTQTTYTARQALFVKADDGPRLLMFDGLAQIYDVDSGTLATTTFDDFSVGVADLIPTPKRQRLDPRQVPTLELLRADDALQTQTRRSEAWLLREAHLRFAESLLPAALSVMGFAALMLGTFSRFGLWRQLIFAVLLVVLIKVIDNAVADLAKRSPDLWPVIYAPTALTGCFAVGLLWLGGGRLQVVTKALRRSRT